MQETEFIGQNKEKWQEFEQLLGNRNKDPDRLTNLFIETTDDLSYSQTYYGNRSIRVYLNRVAQQVYQAIYRNRSKSRGTRASYWLRDLPEALWHGRRALLTAFLVFIGGVAIGIFSSVHYPEFARIILGSSYVEMTEANIQNGDPMAVYQDDDAMEMFFSIALNNIRVGFFAFILGLTFAVGTYYVLLYNGIMVGAFVYFFIERGLFRESFLAIMLHGTLELSMIVLSGAAGLILARGLLFPGTYTRTQALVHSARSGIKIMLAVSVFLVYAAIIESFATRYTRLPGVPNGQLILDLFRLVVILISAGIVTGYFVIYPRVLRRRGHIGDPVMEELPPTPTHVIPLDTIKTGGRIFTESFLIFGRNARRAASTAALLSLAFTGFYTWLSAGKMNEIFQWPSDYLNPLGPLWVWDNYKYHMNFSRFPAAFPAQIILFTLWMYLTGRQFVRTVYPARPVPGARHLLGALLIATLAGLPLLLSQGWTVLIELFWFPICCFVYMSGILRDRLFPASLGDAMRLLRGSFWKTIGTATLILSIQWLILMILYSDFAWLGLDFIQMNLSRFSWLSRQLPYVIYTFLIAFISLMAFSLTIYGMGLQVFSQQEVNEASSLRQAINKIGFKRRAYGLEKE